MRAGLIGLAALVLAGPAGAVTYMETANPALTTTTVYPAMPVYYTGLGVQFTIPQPIQLDATGDELDVNVPFAAPVSLPISDIGPQLYDATLYNNNGYVFELFAPVFFSTGMSSVEVTGVQARYYLQLYNQHVPTSVGISGDVGLVFSDVPELPAWSLMAIGFGALGGSLRAFSARDGARRRALAV